MFQRVPLRQNLKNAQEWRGNATYRVNIGGKVSIELFGLTFFDSGELHSEPQKHTKMF